MSRNFDADPLRHGKSLKLRTIFSSPKSKYTFISMSLMMETTDLRALPSMLCSPSSGMIFQPGTKIRLKSKIRLSILFILPFLEPNDFLMLKDTSCPCCLLTDSGHGLEHLGKYFLWLINFTEERWFAEVGLSCGCEESCADISLKSKLYFYQLYKLTRPIGLHQCSHLIDGLIPHSPRVCCWVRPRRRFLPGVPEAAGPPQLLVEAPDLGEGGTGPEGTEQGGVGRDGRPGQAGRGRPGVSGGSAMYTVRG